MKFFVVLFAAFLLVLPTGRFFAQEPTGNEQKVYVIPIHGEINQNLTVFVRRSIQEAKRNDASYIVFDIDTFGGLVDSALQITTLIGSATNAVTIAYVPAVAEGTGVSWSAGSLISLSCNRIYMAPGTSIGAAAPVYQTAQGMEMAPEKEVSAIRTQMASLAEKNGYPRSVALAMVDMDVELSEVYLGDKLVLATADDMPDLERKARQENLKLEKGRVISHSGKLLTLTAADMLKYGISTETVSSLDALYGSIGVNPANTVVLSQTAADRAASFLTSSLVTMILVLGGLVALYIEITSPGFGVPGTIAIICFAVVFLGSALLGTVGSLELLMFIAGVALLVVEIFLIPGFGITGISGIVLIAAAVVLSRQDFVIPEVPWQWEVFRRNLLVVGLSVIGSIIVFGIIIRSFPRLPLFRRLILSSTSPSARGIFTAGTGATADARAMVGRGTRKEAEGRGESRRRRVAASGNEPPPARPTASEAFLGREGVAVTILRPAGKAEIAGDVLDVRTDGEYVEKGARVVVVEARGNKILVRRL